MNNTRFDNIDLMINDSEKEIFILNKLIDQHKRIIEKYEERIIRLCNSLMENNQERII